MKHIKTSYNEYLYLKENLINDDIKDFLNSKNININKYIKSGTKGHIYELDNGNILKISDYNIESHYRDYKYMAGKNNEHLVDIYDVYKHKGNLFIIMENLDKYIYNRYGKFDYPNSDEREIMQSFLSYLNYEKDSNKDNIDDVIEEFMNTTEFKELINRREIDIDQAESILWDLDIMFEAQLELDNKYGLYLKDFHSGNIMKSNKTNDYKLIDFL